MRPLRGLRPERATTTAQQQVNMESSEASCDDPLAVAVADVGTAVAAGLDDDDGGVMVDMAVLGSG